MSKSVIDNEHEFREVMKRVSYKPGWEFLAKYSTLRHNIQVMVIGKFLDSYHPDRIIDITTVVLIELPTDVDWALKTIFMGINNLESHEHDEWLKVDGQLVKNPHAR